MWENILQQILNNLQFVGFGMCLFIIAYLSNMCFSIYINCKILGEQFDKSKIINSGLKILAFGIGTAFLCVSVTAIPIFANAIGFTIPEMYATVFEDLVIIGVFIVSSCKYALEAFDKMKNILNNGESLKDK